MKIKFKPGTGGIGQQLQYTLQQKAEAIIEAQNSTKPLTPKITPSTPMLLCEEIVIYVL